MFLDKKSRNISETARVEVLGLCFDFLDQVSICFDFLDPTKKCQTLFEPVQISLNFHSQNLIFFDFLDCLDQHL